jgi:hypothetical protein
MGFGSVPAMSSVVARENTEDVDRFLGSAEQGPCFFKMLLASLSDREGHMVLQRFSGGWSKVIWSQLTQLRSLSRRDLKRFTQFLEQRGVRHE